MTRLEDRRLIVFRSRLRPDVEAEYGPRAEQVYELAEAMPGFVSAKDFVADDGERLALIEFDSPAHLAAWRDHAEHRVAQEQGRSQFYSEYSLQICAIVRESHFDGVTRRATEAPAAAAAFEGAGGCACGALRYQVRGVPQNATLCHCSDCRLASGATPVAWATFKTKEVTFASQPPSERASSARARRGFCSACGTQLTFTYVAQPEFVDVTLATLDDFEAIAPEDHTWVRSKPGWLRVGDDLPRYERERS
jgi:heme-degrading monooxygenase HmoA